MYKFPIRIPEGWNLTVVQPFHTAAPVDISHALSIQTVDHLGVDVVCGTREQSWGSACVWPFPWTGTVYEAAVDSPMGATQHAHSQIDTTDPSTGIKYSLIYLHISAIVPGTTFSQGDTIGFIGNNGAVQPPPTPQDPFAGTHLHLGLGIKKPGDLNATMVDPLPYFDLSNPFRGPDDPSRDQAVYDWAKANGGPDIPSFPPTQPPAPLSASDQIAVFAAQKMGQGQMAAATALFALAKFLKAFGY